MDPTGGRGWMRMRLALIGTVAAMIVGITGALVAAQSPTPSPTPTAPSPSPSLSTQAQAGRILYLRDCAWCHGQDGSGGQFGPSLVGVGAESADFMLST